MIVRKRSWISPVGGEVKNAWVCDFKDLKGHRRLKTFRLKKEADRFSTKIRADLLDASLKENGPASVGALPDRGSNIPRKDIDMNGPKPNTAAASAPAPKPTPDQVAHAMRELEEKVLDLMHMARITNDIAERSFNAPHERVEDKLVFHLSFGEREAFMFALHDVERRSKKLAHDYLAAWDGRVEA